MDSTTNPQQAKKQAFTLIELLVVIAIIAVLLAVMLPCIRAVRSVAKRAVCGSRLRQIAVAWQTYVDDHQGRFYQAVNANIKYGGWDSDRKLLPRPLNRYLQVPGVAKEREAHIFLCPSDRGGNPDRPLEKVYRYDGTSFSTNILLVGQDKIGSLNRPTIDTDPEGKYKRFIEEINKRLPNMNIKKAAYHSLLVLMGDYGWFNQWQRAPLSAANKELAVWHGRPASHNMAFLDGHVRFLRIPDSVWVSENFAVLPFKDLYPLASEVQELY